VDQSNQPFLINSDTAWSLIVGLKQAEAAQYLADRRSRGFNAVLVELIEHEFSSNPPANAYGDQPFSTAGDFSTPNEQYFAHADWVLNEAAKNGILVLLTPAYLGFGCGSQGWCQEMMANGTDKMKEYGRYLGARYKNFKNIIWVHGGDANANDHGAMDVTQAVVDGIKEVDGDHLHTAHCDRQNSALDCYDKPWLNINTTYSNCSLSASKTKTDYNRARVMPFFFIEGTYEGEGGDPQCWRSQTYWSILGGSTGHVFGNRPIWLFGSGWQTALSAVGSQSMSQVGALFASRPWVTLVPDYNHQVLTAGYGSIDNNSYASAAHTADGNSVIAYMPTTRKVSLDLSKVAGTEAKAWWFNPETGKATLSSEPFPPPLRRTSRLRQQAIGCSY
jgi:hypothetical protein